MGKATKSKSTAKKGNVVIKIAEEKQKGYVQRKSERGQGLKFKLETFATVSAFTPGTKIKYGPNPKTAGSKSYTRYAGYAKAKTVGESLKFGAKIADFLWELERDQYKVLGGARTEAQEVDAIGQAAYTRAKNVLSAFNGPRGLSMRMDDPKAAEELAKEEAWRSKKLKHCEEVAKKMGLKPESAAEIEKYNESADIRLQRRVADTVAAAKLQTGKKIVDSDVSEVLGLWGFCENNGRLNVLPNGRKYVYSDTIGAIRRRTGGWGLTPPTERYPNFPKLLCKWLSDNKPKLKCKFVCTAININANYAGRRHRDQNNEGPSIIRAFGKFSGGSLNYWPKDLKKAGRAAVETLSPKDSVTYNLAKSTFVFDGNRAHEVESFTGDRYSIVFFTGRGYGNVKAEEVKKMEKLGFPWPTPKTLAAVKDETKTL